MLFFYGFSGLVQPFANRLEPELHRQLNQSHGKCGGERDGRRLDHLLPALAQVGANITRGLDQGLGDGFDRICLQVQGDQVDDNWKIPPEELFRRKRKNKVDYSVIGLESTCEY